MQMSAFIFEYMQITCKRVRQSYKGKLGTPEPKLLWSQEMGYQGDGSGGKSWLMVTWDVDDCAKGKSVGPSPVRADALVEKIGARFLTTSSRTTDVVSGWDFTT